MLGAGGQTKNCLVWGNPCPNFFQCIDLVIFFSQNKGGGGKGCPNLFEWVGLVTIFSDKMSSDNS